jgi:polar amino acid transport system substrate-binding protein
MRTFRPGPFLCLRRTHTSARPRKARPLPHIAFFLALAFAIALGASSASAERDKGVADRPATLIVGTKSSPPFAIKNDDGSWSGIAIELWRMVAADLGFKYELREYDLKGLLAAVQNREVDIAVSALTITAERETQMDFSHPIYSTGLSIAVLPKANGGGAWAILRGLVSWDLAKLLLVLTGLLTAIGTLVWLFERRRNDTQFGGGVLKGIGAGVWWSAVTMTTVGYGDKSPVTMGGRILGLIWMFAAVILISSFTASITSTLTVDRLESAIKGPEDLVHVRVATVPGSTSAAYLDRHHVGYRPVATPLEGLRAVAAREVDAMVYDAPILQYVAKHDLGGAVTVLPMTFDRQDYGFALPDDTLREPINRALLGELGKDTWRELLDRYVGP